MKISNRTTPIIDRLVNKSLGKVAISKNIKWFEEYLPALNKHFIDHVDFFKSKIDYITKPFADALEANVKKLSSVFDDIANEKGEQNTDEVLDYLQLNNLSGTIIYKNSTYLYYISREDTTVIEFVKYNNFDHLVLVSFYTYRTKIPIYVDPEIINPEFNINDDMLYSIKNILGLVINVFMFKTYAQVETKELLPGKKVKDVNCKYINETKLPITYLDSKWFTTLVKSDAFKVRGHFRLQPKKQNGKWTRELIWISDFIKSGYTAPARKLSHEPSK